jgi:hypothetical protein
MYLNLANPFTNADKSGKGFAVGVTRMGNHGAPRHCSSPAPFDESLFVWGTAPPVLEVFYYVLFEDRGAGLKLRYHRDSAYVVCEE